MVHAARATATSLLLATAAAIAASLFTTVLPQPAVDHGARASEPSISAVAPDDLTWG